MGKADDSAANEVDCSVAGGASDSSAARTAAVSELSAMVFGERGTGLSATVMVVESWEGSEEILLGFSANATLLK